jgi:hypothetical protein
VNVTQIPTGRLAGRELQPLAQLSAPLQNLAREFSWEVTAESGDELGPIDVVALTVDSVRYLLRTYEHSPVATTEIHTPESGDPTEQLRRLLGRVEGLGRHLSHWWDGASWRDTPFPTAA